MAEKHPDWSNEHARIREWADRLYAAGLSIIPLTHPYSADGKDAGKAPTVQWKTYQHRRPTPGEIKRWFHDERELHNIGVVCGPLSGVVVIDIDSPEAKRAAHTQQWPFPSKWVRTTKGEHWYFAWNEKYTIGNCTKLRINGCKQAIDVRGQGGYVVGPGSRHASGEVYELREEDVCAWNEIAPLPDQLGEMLEVKVQWHADAFTPQVQDRAQAMLMIATCACARTRSLLKGNVRFGERNDRIYRAARDLNGLGIPLALAEELILKAVPIQNQDDERGFRATIRSAYKNPAIPTVIASLMDAGDFEEARREYAEFQRATTPSPDRMTAAPDVARVTRPAPVPPPEDEEESDGMIERPDGSMADAALPENDPTILATPNELRLALGHPPRVTNVDHYETEDEEGEVKVVFTYKPALQIRDELVKGLKGWPKLAGSTLFAIRNWDGRSIADSRNIVWMEDDTALFAWLQTVCDGVYWHTRPVRTSKIDPSLQSVCTKAEFYKVLQGHPGAEYSGVEFLPHFPALQDVYYLVPEFPEVDPELPLWNQWISMFNPDTEVDRKLIMAACLTPAWGGRAGKRPAFLFTSDHGRGVGKSATAEAIASLYGGAIQPTQIEGGPKGLPKALVSPEALTKRVVVWDNLKGRQDYAIAESMITCPSIQGHRLYVGHTPRPNYLTWLLTANHPETSNDLAQRCFPVKIGPPKHDVDFESRYHEFLDENRLGLLSEILVILQSEPRWKPAPGMADRWQSWINGVLTRIPDAMDVMSVIRERRTLIDVDLEESRIIVDLILELIRRDGWVESARRTGKFVFSTCTLHELAREHQFTELGLVAFSRWLGRKISDGDLKYLEPIKRAASNSRGYVFNPGVERMRELLGDETEDAMLEAGRMFGDAA